MPGNPGRSSKRVGHLLLEVSIQDENSMADSRACCLRWHASWDPLREWMLFLSSRFSSNRYNSVETISRIISHHSCSGTPDRKAHLIYATLIRIAFGTRQFYIAPSPAHPSIDDYISDNWYSFAALHLLNAFLVNHPLHLVHIPTDPTSLATYCFPTFLALTFAFLGHHKLLK